MNNFQSFLSDYKSNNPKDSLEKSLSKFSDDLKAVIAGFKEMMMSNRKSSTPETATSVIKEFEKQRDQEFEIERVDFGEVKDILNAIAVNTSPATQSKNLIAYENRDNFISPNESEAKDAKFEFDMEKKQFLMQKEQLEVVKEIRDILKPKVPSELEEKKSKPIDLLAYLSENNNQSPASPSIEIDRNNKKGNNTVITDTDDKKKKTTTKPKQSKLNKVMGGVGKLGLGAAAALGAGYFLNDVYNQTQKEEFEAKTKEIEADLLNGSISQEQADSMKGELEVEYKKDLTKNISEDVGNISGTIAGGFAGAKIGGVLGPIGAIGGGIIGSILGGVGGTEAGKQVGDMLNDKNVEEMINDTKKKAAETLDTTQEKYKEAKEFIQTDLLPEASKKIESFITTIKESVNVDKIREKAASGLETLRDIVQPETSSQAEKMIGSKPGKFVSDTIRETERIVETPSNDSSKMLVNNVVNNQTSNNFIPLKATPRAEHSGSALDRYTDRLSMF